MECKRKHTIIILLTIGLVLIVSCSTTPRIKEPTSESSTLLLGRITLRCMDFPENFHVNGIHTDGVTVYIGNYTTKDFISIRSHGADGLFYLVDPEPPDGQYFIAGFGLETGSSRMTLRLSHETKDDPFYFVLKENAVNNLGDIRWDDRYEEQVTKEYTRKGSHSGISTVGWHEYKQNGDEVESWFKNTYPDSDWNRKIWISVENLIN